ncbi:MULTISPECIES: allose kinase [Pectobacterium]|uniref:Allose kinase n=1 Tax=Pectobacterium punjabense TaxID=2108399 RepID=A0ABX6L7C2_9GAMM|nr:MULTISPECIES: allose kinase [Pectobacterium]MBN3134631.1 allose kinase [Pectobacterium punjabense]MBS4430589.1 allose kinase [Pectobacterium punjabense]MBT9183704.1 allose kinase [Pectobacterium punjabense]MCE5381031.1 allose kinase [Pectobacterium punjabense]MCE9733325.1 sugar kinase [Pectobacterium sp. IFB5596]
MTECWLGIDIGGTSTRLMLMDAQHQWSGFRKIATESWAQQPDALAALTEVIAQTLEPQTVNGVMLGLPGILSRDRQSVLSLPFIPALDGQPVAQKISERLGIPVAMDKDVNHLMLWDLMQLKTLPDTAIGIYLGTGIGNSLWLNGRFYHGEHGGAGELGHIPWPDNQQPCPCGNLGCVETLTSGHWLKNWAIQQGDSAMSSLFTRWGTHPDLQAFIDRLAKVVAMEMNIFDPDYLVLGGGVLSMVDFPHAALRDGIWQHLRPPMTREKLNMVFSEATDYTGCRGACLAAERQFGRKA